MHPLVAKLYLQSVALTVIAATHFTIMIISTGVKTRDSICKRRTPLYLQYPLVWLGWAQAVEIALGNFR